MHNIIFPCNITMLSILFDKYKTIINCITLFLGTYLRGGEVYLVTRVGKLFSPFRGWNIYIDILLLSILMYQKNKNE